VVLNAASSARSMGCWNGHMVPPPPPCWTVAGPHSSAPRMGECFHPTPAETNVAEGVSRTTSISRSRNVEHRAYAGAVVGVSPDSDALCIATHILPSPYSVSFNVSWLLPLHSFQKVCSLRYLLGGNRDGILVLLISSPIWVITASRYGLALLSIPMPNRTQPQYLCQHGGYGSPALSVHSR